MSLGIATAATPPAALIPPAILPPVIESPANTCPCDVYVPCIGVPARSGVAGDRMVAMPDGSPEGGADPLALSGSVRQAAKWGEDISIKPSTEWVHISMESLEEAQTLFKAGKTSERVAWDLIVPKAPHGGSLIVTAGLEPALSDIRARRFNKEVIDTLKKTGRFSEEFLAYLFEFNFDGDIDAVQEGRFVSPGIPVMRIFASETELALLKDLIKNRMGVSMTVATKAARISQAANGDFIDEALLAKIQSQYGMSEAEIKRMRTILDFGLRRAQGSAADLATRSAIIGGAAKTSNVRAALKHYLQMSGTMAHLFIMLYPPGEEIQAFRDYVKAWPGWCTLLVDTYDTINGARNAIIVAKEMEARGEKLVGVRLDSGNIAKLSREVRQMLDSAGLNYVKIFASNDLDEDALNELLANGAYIDGVGVGTNMITGGRDAHLPMEFIRSNEDRIWRCHQGKGKARFYVRTPKNRMAYADYGQEIQELLVPFWRGGLRVFGEEKPWKAHERLKREIERFTPEQKRLCDAEDIPVVVQDNPLTIDPYTDASITVDEQGAFTKGGGLAVTGGDDVVPVTRRVIGLLPGGRKQAVATIDMHRKGSVSLASSFIGFAPLTLLTYDMVRDWTEENNKIAPHALFSLQQLKDYLKKVGAQMLWPDHALEETAESELHPGLRTSDFGTVVVKGMDPAVDSYSGFFDNAGNSTGLADKLRKAGVKRIFVKGLAGDYCVGFTAIGAAQEGFEVYVVEDAQRNVNFPADQLEKIYAEYKRLGIKIVQSAEIVEANRHVGIFPAPMLARPITHPVDVDDNADVAFKEDAYHLTMGQAIFMNGMAGREVTFDYFFRTGPYAGSQTIVGGLRFLLAEIRDFRFSDDLIEYLAKRSEHDFTPEYMDYLRNFRPDVTIDSLPDGSVAFPSEPVMTIRGGALAAQLIETFILNRRNFDGLIASNANAFRERLGDDAVIIESGMADAQGDAHLEAAYYAYIGGADFTTNIDAHHFFGIPLANEETKGVRLRAELVTGGERTALNGVYKLARIEGDGRLKLSDDPRKTTLPGNKDIAVVVGPDGLAVRRMIIGGGEDIALGDGETILRPRVRVMEGGEILYSPDIEADRERRKRDVRMHRGIQAAEVSSALLAHQQRLVAQARNAIGGGQG